MGRIFGTDGARGVANTEISCKLAMNLGRAAAMVVAERIAKKPVFIIGCDTRISSGMLEAAISAGLCSVGADAVIAGVLPTPAVSYLVTNEHADAGIMLSASHNPYEFNGIKIFGPDGYKLTDAEEFEIEEIVLDNVKPYSIRWGWEVGRIHRQDDLAEHYIDYIAGTAPNGLEGLKIAVDCSNGSASATAGKLFKKLGADATILNAAPNGVNINRDCGSTHVENLAEYVKNGDFDAGIAFDGDADRVIAVDELGNVINGDFIMAILGLDLKRHGKLKNDTIAATVMSNLGLFKFGEENGIHVEKARVGDRYVLEMMRKKGYCLGGEQSGHIILSDFLMTGDGQLSAIQLLSVAKKNGKKLSELGGVMKTYPQMMKNIHADHVMKKNLATDKAVAEMIDKAQEKLGGDGRVLVRASGTEPIIRVMIEGKDKDEIAALLDKLTEQIEERLSDNEDCKRMAGL